MITTIVAAIIVLGALIIVHETGHFLAAKKMGVGVEKFSIGFGRPIWKKKSGETEYILAWIPFGGYVKMVGDEEEEDAEKIENPDLAFNLKPIWRRSLIVAAGPAANLLLAILLFAVVYMVGISMPDTKILEVMKDSPAQAAGLVNGDRIVEINDTPIESWDQLAEIISGSAGTQVSILAERVDGSLEEIRVTPEPHSSKTIFGEDVEVGRIGIRPDEIFKRYGPVVAVWRGTLQTGKIIYMTGLVIVKIFQNVVPADNIGGPLMIMKMAGDQAEAGLVPLLMFMGLISVNLGILNILPIPILDGGHLLFFLVEAIKGKPVTIKGRIIAQQVGMFLLISLMAFAFYNDISRFISGN
ncbi:MAG: RIP metalloprotease RseP [Nitrospinota bacterium]